MKRFLAAVFSLLLLFSLVPAASFAAALDFTVIYKTNAGVEMGVIPYVYSSDNHFPTPGEFSTYFQPFLERAAQKGSIAVASQCWY